MRWLLFLVFLSASGGLGQFHDRVETVEFNTFGTALRVRTAILFRDPASLHFPDGRIIDWRWYVPEKTRTDGKTPQQTPVALSTGGYLMIWEDGGVPRTVLFRRVYYTRTKQDVELEARKKFPAHFRRKLR